MSAFLALRAAAFLVVPLMYWWADFLNYSQAGKSALLGIFPVLALSAWRASQPSLATVRGMAWDAAVALLFFFILALQAFLRDYFGAQADDLLVIEAIFNTNSAEAGEFFLLNLRAIGRHAALLGAAVCLYGALAWYSGRRFSTSLGASATSGSLAPARQRRLRMIAAVCTAIFLLLHFNPTMRRADPLLYFPLRYAKWHKGLEQTRALQAELAATLDHPDLQSMQYVGDGPQTVVFVLGESATRRNWSLYGYPRPTTPKLESVSQDLVKFADVVTGYPGTDGSLKQILTPASIAEPELWKSQPDILTMAKRAGYKTFWLTNHGTRSGMISIIASHADVVEYTNRGSSRGEGYYDEVLLPELQKALDDPHPLKFIVVHMLGAHPAYHFRYPKAFSRFDADDQVARELTAAGRASWAVLLRNQYDNAMLYADHLLHASLEMARRAATAHPVAWLYAPDHGEDVAHYNNFAGHNPRVPAMYEVPMLAWASEGFGLNESAAERPYQLDVLDHTLLGLMRISGRYYDPRNDVLSKDFRPKPRYMSGIPYPAAAANAVDKPLDRDGRKTPGGDKQRRADGLDRVARASQEASHALSSRPVPRAATMRRAPLLE